MHFVGLAAGRGKRLNPLTNIMQKCMYPIAGAPFLEYTLREVGAGRRYVVFDVFVLEVVSV